MPLDKAAHHPNKKIQALLERKGRKWLLAR